MTDGQSPTQWLSKVGADPQAEVKLAAYMRSRARSVAAYWIGDRVQAGVGPTDVAAIAVASVFKQLQASEARPADSRSLFNLLARVTHNKAVDVLRRRHSDKREIAREEPVIPHVPDGGDSPADLAIADELSKRVIELIEQEPDDLRRLVTYLAIIEERTGPEIVAAIEAEAQSAGWHIPSVSAIYVWVRAARARIVESLRNEGFLDKDFSHEE